MNKNDNDSLIIKRYKTCLKCARNHGRYDISEVIQKAISENRDVWTNPQDMLSYTRMIKPGLAADLNLCNGCLYELEHVMFSQKEENLK